MNKKSVFVSNQDLAADGRDRKSGKVGDKSLRSNAARDAASTAVMEANFQKTTPDESEDDRDSDDDVDQAGVLLQGFDSDTEDPAKDVGLDHDQPTAALPQVKKTQETLTQAASQTTSLKDGPGVVYVGRIPHGFYEDEMRDYFSQYGAISRLRLSRNRYTGRSKHFAFIEFESNEVAKIVAEAMDNYLMYGHILKCKFVRPGTLHPDTFKGANRRFRVVPRNRIEKRALEAPRSETRWTLKNRREQARREKKLAKLQKIGYEIELPKLKAPEEALGRRSKVEERPAPG